MVKIASKDSSAARQHFITEFESLLAPWGLSGSPGLVYGYVLSQDDRVTINQIAADLKISKVSAWKAARDLAAFGHIRRYGEAGSKRALYGAAESFALPIQKQAGLLSALASLLEQTSPALTPEAAARTAAMSAFYRALSDAIGRIVRSFEVSPAPAAKTTKSKPQKRKR